MIIGNFTGYFLFIISLIILLTVQRLLHRELQTIFLLLTRNPKFALGIFSLLLFPGVFIHEFSHWLMAIILRVPVRSMSLLPQTQKNGRLRLGFVETKQTDVIRDSLIGLAPFIIACALLASIGSKLGLFDVVQMALTGNPEGFTAALVQLPKQTDFGIWFYLAFAISSTMIPSSADRESWRFILIGLGIILIIVVIAGFGDWMLLNVAPSINLWLYAVAMILGVSVFVHILLYLPSFLLKTLLIKMMGVEIRHG